MRTIHVVQIRRRDIDFAIVQALEQDAAEHKGVYPAVVAIVPKMLTFFGPSPDRYEVTAAAIIVRD